MKLKAVRIIHNIKTRIDFSYMAEFFRLAGIYVVECIDNDEEESPYQNNDNCYDITIDTCGSEKAYDYGQSVDFREIRKRNSITGNLHQCDKKMQKKVLLQTLEAIADLVYEDRPGIIWETLIANFVESNLVLHSLNMQYYFKKASFVIENARNVFYALQRIMSSYLGMINPNDPEKRYLEYALIYCKVKVNVGCKFMGQGFEFPIEELAGECTECINKYPEFSNLKVLLGLCYEYEPMYAPLAIRAFIQALQDEDMYCYSSHIYYWIGKQYEAYEVNWKDAVRNYQYSYEKKHKYKNKYKIAIAERIDGNYETAIREFSWIIDKLQYKFSVGMIDPLELEYYFKSKSMIATIYFNDMKNYLKAIEYGESLISNYDRMVMESRFYFELYGGDAPIYQKLTKQRFDLKRVRSILYYSYHYLGIEEKAIQFFDMEDA